MLENLEKSVCCFSKWDLSCKSVFWGCEFSGVLVFSETQDFNRSLCFTLQAVAQKQRQMLVKLKKDIFLKLRCIIQLSFVRLRFPIVLVFSEKHGFSNIPCVNVRGGCQATTENVWEVEETSDSRNEFFFHATVFLAFKIVRNAYMSRAWCTGNGHPLAPRATR